MEGKKIIKHAPVIGEVEKEKKAYELKQDIAGFFEEKDKTNRGLDGRTEDVTELSAIELEQKEMLYEDSLKEIPVPNCVEPMFNEIFLTAKRNKVSTAGGIIISQSTNSEGLEIDYEEIQTVMACGPQVQQLKKGYSVSVNFEHFRERLGATMAEKVNKETKLTIPIISIDGVDYIKVSERDIKYINNNLK